jgi:hypothetical protein
MHATRTRTLRVLRQLTRKPSSCSCSLVIRRQYAQIEDMLLITSSGVKTEDVVTLSDRFWDFYLKGLLVTTICPTA